MTLRDKWEQLAGSFTDPAMQAQFWNEYFTAEAENYKKILSAGENFYKGTLTELAKEFDMTDEYFLGFISGINSSLKAGEYDLDTLEVDSEINLEPAWETLYFNMCDAKADWLYNLPEWEGILDAETRKRILREWRKSVQAKKEVTVGRNDPCPCGSGKKYKKCCGKNA